MRVSLLFLTLPVVLAGCVTTHLSEKGAKVKIADPAQAPLAQGCRQVAPLQSTGVSEKETIAGLKNQAADKGANLVISKLQFDREHCESPLTCEINSQGVAYDCPAELLGKFVSSEAF